MEFLLELGAIISNEISSLNPLLILCKSKFFADAPNLGPLPWATAIQKNNYFKLKGVVSNRLPLERKEKEITAFVWFMEETKKKMKEQVAEFSSFYGQSPASTLVTMDDQIIDLGHLSDTPIKYSEKAEVSKWIRSFTYRDDLIVFTELFWKLIHLGTDPFATDPLTGASILHYLCMDDVLNPLVNSFLQKYPNFPISLCDKMMDSPFMVAIKSCALLNVKTLLSFGADLKQNGKYGSTPLHILFESAIVTQYEGNPVNLNQEITTPIFIPHWESSRIYKMDYFMFPSSLYCSKIEQTPLSYPTWFDSPLPNSNQIIDLIPVTQHHPVVIWEDIFSKLPQETIMNLIQIRDHFGLTPLHWIIGHRIYNKVAVVLPESSMRRNNAPLFQSQPGVGSERTSIEHREDFILHMKKQQMEMESHADLWERNQLLKCGTLFGVLEKHKGLPVLLIFDMVNNQNEMKILVNMQDEVGETALHKLCQMSNLDVNIFVSMWFSETSVKKKTKTFAKYLHRLKNAHVNPLLKNHREQVAIHFLKNLSFVSQYLGVFPDSGKTKSLFYL